MESSSRRKQVDDEDNGRDSIAGRSKRLKLEEVGDVSVSGGKKVTSSNPLLIDLVLENVFSCLKNSPQSYLKNLRLVCKLWDRKIKETLRKKTEIDVIKLVSPYPEGLGWTTESSDENGESSFYDCPYQVEPNFENLKVIGTCETLNNVGVIHWFERMGSSVKSLHFQSSLTCFHHTRFLECVMKRWCINLSRLYLDGFIWNGRFAISSGFNNDPFLMDHLKEIILYGDSNLKEKGSDCVRAIGLEGTYLNYTQSESNEDIVDINVKRSDDSCGVWENIMCNVGSEKLLIENLPSKYDNSYCKQLFPASVMREKQVRLVKTLKHFEYTNFLLFHDHTDFIHFAEIKFPITKLCFGPLPYYLDGSRVTSLLESLSATLQHLEFQGIVCREQSRRVASRTVEVRIPPLPHLKFFKNRNVSVIQTGRLDFVKNLPSLETCSLQNGISAGQFRSIRSLVEPVYFKPEEKHKNLKKLELIGTIKFGTHIEQLRSWFPNLKSLEVMLEGADGFDGFKCILSEVELEEIKISFYTSDYSLIKKLIFSLCEMSSLRFLELDYLTGNPGKLSLSICQNAFAKAPKLTSLKLKNVTVFVEERERIREVLSHISCVSLTDCVFQLQPGPTDIEFSIGIGAKFPAIDWSNTTE